MDVIEFKQNDIINYINLPENKVLFTKVAQVYGVDFSSSEGFCYGISNEFMRYAHNNKGDRYILNINNLLSIIAESGEGLSEVAKVKLQATQQHAKSLLNNYIIKMIYSQSINNKIGEINSRYYNLKYPEELIGKNIRKEIESIINYNQLNSDFNISTQGREYTHQFNDYIAKMSQIILDKYMDAIFSEEGFFNTEEGINLSKDALFKEIYKEFKNRVSNLNDNYDLKDIKFIFNIIYQDIVRQEILKLENYAKINGLMIIGSHETKLNYRNMLTFEIELHKVISFLAYHVKNERSPFIYSFNSWNHAMTMNVTIDEMSGLWVYRFFDPNEGIVKTHDLNEFSNFLHNFVDTYQDIYKFRKTKDGEYTVLLLDFTSNKKNINDSLETLDYHKIAITNNVLLSERKIAFIIEEKNIKILHDEFNIENGIVKLKVSINNNEFFVYTDVLDNFEIYRKITRHSQLLLNSKSDIFIHKSSFEIYKVKDNTVFNRFLSFISKTDDNNEIINSEALKIFFGEASFNISSEFDSIQIRKQKVSILLERVILGELSIKNINFNDYPYLAIYFMDENGGLDFKKLNSAIYDPLLNVQFNHYLNENVEDNKIDWMGIFNSEIPIKLSQQAENIHTLLSAIKNDLLVLNHLSSKSKALLKEVFPAGDGTDNGKIIDTITDNNKFSLLSEKLTGFSQLGAHNFEGENAALKNLTFSEAFKLYDEEHSQRLQQYNQLMNQQKMRDIDYQIGLVNHGVVRSKHQSHTHDQLLGTIYAIEYSLTDVHTARDIIERQAQLEEASSKNTISLAEEKLLTEIRKYGLSLHDIISHEGIAVADQSISHLFSGQGEIKNSIRFLKGKQAVYTAIYREHNGVYEYCLFDPQGIQFSVKHENRQSAKQQFQQQVERYFSEEIQLADGQKISRGKAAGFSEIEGGGFRADIQSIDLDASQVKTSLTESLNARRLIHQNEVFPAPKNCWVKFGDEKISFAKLQQLGATINGKPLSMADIAMDNLHKRIRFSPEKLTNYFTLMEGSQNDLTFIKIFNDQINANNIYQLIENEGTFTETAVLKKQLRYLANGVDLQQDKIPDVVLKNMQQAGIKLPRYQRIANRFGQGMGAAGAIQTLISAHTILNQLDNPDLTKDEIKELEKQFYLLCASAFFNYGDMVLQPMLLNIASAKGATSLFKARLAMGTVVVFNLVGMGLDAYQAYDSLSKLDTVTDPKQRQDLIVNASFSIASCIISGVVVVGILVGASTIPVVGLAIGGVLIVGGWIYSGVRAVENIKEVIDIDWDRELEEGIRGALGIEPTLRTQQEINAKLYIDAFKQQDWNMDLAQFEQQLLPASFDQHFSIVEKPTQQSETRFYLVDGHGNYFYGALSSRKPIHSRAYIFFSKKNAPSFTEEDANFILENKSYRNSSWIRNLARIYRDNGLQIKRDFSLKKEVKEVNDYVRVGSEPTNEMYFLNPNYQNPLLERFKTRFKIPNVYTQSSIEKQLMVSSPEQISLFSRQNRYEAFKPETDQKSSKGEQYINDRYRIAWYLEDKNSAGTSWNTANGNDVVIGYAEQKNAFQVLSGEKYFAGGNHDDLFYIRDGSLASLQANGGNLPTKYLDGQAGVDTVIVDSLSKDHHVYAHLAGNTLSYKQEGNKPFIPVAHLQGVENVIVKGNTNDSLRGNDDDNILDGGFGKDLLIGEGGNDKLILTQGTAIGGEGNDRYHVRRCQWFEAVDALYSTERYWEQSEKKVKTRRYLNPVYQEIARKFEANVVIEEMSQSQSTVSLEYSLNEIKRVFVDGNDLHLVINLPSSKIDGITYENIESIVTIELKNAVRKHNGQNNIHHQYRVQTQDGFVMETRFEEERPNQYFTIRYIESLDQTEVPESNVVKINEELNTISVDEKRHYTAPDWGWFTHVGGAKQLEYCGNSQNNMLPFLQAGSHIQVSRGVDTYQVVQSKPDDREITFDFSAVNSQYTDKDKVILLLPNENGYLLTMNGLRLQRVDQQGKVHLNIHFTQVGSELEDVVLIQDKYSNLFTVNVKTQTLSPLNPVAESTDDSDAIILPVGYQSALPVINGKQGDDIIMDRSGYGHVLVGGEGDDKVVASDGENVLISLAGEDYLSGGKGDDLYIVSGHGDGDVIISDMEGNNQVILINFESHSVTHHKISDDLDETRYQSESGRKVTVQHNNLLQSKDNIMTFKHLSSKQSLAKVNVESTVDQLVQSLAQQRVNYEANFEPLDNNQNSRYQWGAVQTTERFYNQLT